MVPEVIVLTTVTVHVIAVVAPIGPGPLLLHCPTEVVAANALEVGTTSPASTSAPANSIIARPAKVTPRPDPERDRLVAAGVVLMPPQPF